MKQALAVAAAAVFAHATYRIGGFVWHDHGDILLGRALNADIFARFATTAFFRPVITLCLQLDHTLWGTEPAGFHATNIALHALAAVLVLVAGRLFAPHRHAFFAALVFAVHPLSWQPTGLIAYRPELLLVAMVLLTFIAGRLWLATGRWPALLLVVVAATAALGSKETAIFWLPALGMALVGKRGRRVAWLVASIGLVMAGYLVARHVAVPDLWAAKPVPLPADQAVATRLSIIGRRALEWPGLSLPNLSDAVAVVGLGSPWVWFGALLLSGLGGGLVWGWRRGSRSVWVACGIGLCCIAPALNIVPLPRWSSPHYFYLMPWPLGLLAVAAWDRLNGVAVRRAGAVIGSFWLLAMAWITAAGADRLVDDHALFAPAVAADPAFREGHQWLGHHFWARSPPAAARAREHFEAAIAGPSATSIGRPDQAHAHGQIIAFVDAGAVMFNLAGARVATGDASGAEALLDLLIEDPPAGQHEQTAEMLAVLAYRRGDDIKVLRTLAPHTLKGRRAALHAAATRRLDVVGKRNVPSGAPKTRDSSRHLP